jgi:hypothetical protein
VKSKQGGILYENAHLRQTRSVLKTLFHTFKRPPVLWYDGITKEPEVFMILIDNTILPLPSASVAVVFGGLFMKQ